MNYRLLFLIYFLALTALPMCEAAATNTTAWRRCGAQEQMYFQFCNDSQGWLGGFADLPADRDTVIFDLVFSRQPLPSGLNKDTHGLLLGGTNRSDDLFMFIKRQLTGLKPNTMYEVRYGIEVATDAPSDCVGVGGAPGESVFLKAGASTIEPLAVAKDGLLQMNIDKGNQAEEGRNAIVLGNIANSNRDCANPRYELKRFNNRNRTVKAISDQHGNLWLIIGTDSGFESRTEIFYSNIQVSVTRVP